MKRTLAALTLALLSLTVPALADPTMPDTTGGKTTHTASDGTVYSCMEWDDDMGCRTNEVRYSGDGSAEDLWIAPSGRRYWHSRPTNQYHWDGQGETGSIIDPAPGEQHMNPDGSVC